MAAELRLPGYAICVSSAGKVAFFDAHGPRDQRRAGEVDATTLFRMYSMTKPIICAALMTFYDEGRLGLDDPVSSVLGAAWAPASSPAATPGGLQVAASDGVVRGLAEEQKELQVVGEGDTVFLRAVTSDTHLDVNPSGDCQCRWKDCGEFQAVRFEPLPIPGYAALKAHTGMYLDVENGCVRACSQKAVAWFLRAAAQGSGAGGSTTEGFRAGGRMRLRHQASGLWVHVTTPQAGAEAVSVRTIQDVADATVFVLEKQTWLVSSLVPAQREITVRHLMTHTSGLDYAGVKRHPVTALDALVRPLTERCERGEVTSLAEWTDEIAKMPLRWQPGERYQYGYSIDVLGRVVEVLGQAPLDEVLKARIFAPLGMTSTGFGTTAEDASAKLAALYRLPKEKGAVLKLLDDPQGSQWAPPLGPAPILGGGGGVETLRGGLLSSAADYLRFCHMLLGKGQLEGVRILKESTVELMTEVNHLGIVLENPTARISPGRGFNLLGGIDLPEESLLANPAHNPGMYGWGGWASTMFRVSPSQGVVLLFLTNCIGLDDRVERLLLRRVGEAMRGVGAEGQGPLRRSASAVWQHLQSKGCWWPPAPSAAAGTVALLSAVAVGVASIRACGSLHAAAAR